MSILRRAFGRKEVLMALLIFMLAGGWFGWKWLVSPAAAQEGLLATQVEQVKALLDAGQYRQALAQLDELSGYAADQPALLRYKALAQWLAGEPVAALQTADTALSVAPAGPDAAVAAGVKALVLLGPEYLQIGRASCRERV